MTILSGSRQLLLADHGGDGRQVGAKDRRPRRRRVRRGSMRRGRGGVQRYVQPRRTRLLGVRAVSSK